LTAWRAGGVGTVAGGIRALPAVPGDGVAGWGATTGIVTTCGDGEAVDGGASASPSCPRPGKSDDGIGVDVGIGTSVGVTGAAWIVTRTGAATGVGHGLGDPNRTPPATTE